MNLSIIDLYIWTESRNAGSNESFWTVIPVFINILKSEILSV